MKPAIKRAGTVSGLALPTEPKPIEKDISKYLWLIYGREKIGKTTFCASFPDSIFFSTEPGTKGLSVYEFNAEGGGIKSWEVFRTGVALLAKGGHGFRTVIIDTVDRAYDLCLDWVCNQRGIEYPGEDSSGKNDFGKSWRAVKAEFNEQVYILIQSGIGVVFTSHCREQTIETRSGEKYDRIEPSVGTQARVVIEALVDFFFYAEYVRDKRVLICGGDDTVWAGARASLAGIFPKFLPLVPEGGYDMLCQAFAGEYKGLDPGTLLPSRESSDTGSQFIKRQHALAKSQEVKEKQGQGQGQTAVKKVPKKLG